MDNDDFLVTNTVFERTGLLFRCAPLHTYRIFHSFRLRRTDVMPAFCAMHSPRGTHTSTVVYRLAGAGAANNHRSPRVKRRPSPARNTDLSRLCLRFFYLLYACLCDSPAYHLPSTTCSRLLNISRRRLYSCRTFSPPCRTFNRSGLRDSLLCGRTRSTFGAVTCLLPHHLPGSTLATPLLLLPFPLLPL